MKTKDKFGLTQLDYAYFAGFADSDGCFYISRNSKSVGNTQYSATLTFSNVNPLTLSLLKSKFSGGLYKRDRQKGNTRPYYVYVVTGKKALPLLKGLFPYLILKRQQCKILIDLYTYQQQELTELHVKGKHGMQRFTPEVIRQFETYYQQSRELKRDVILPTDEIHGLSQNHELALSYTGGFIDGDGCFSLTKHTSFGYNPWYQGEVNITNTDNYISILLQNRFKGNVYKREPSTPKGKYQTRWQLAGKSAISFITDIRPYIRLKSLQAKTLLQFLEYKEIVYARLRDRTKGTNNSYPKEVIDKFETFYQTMKVLNKTGRT